MPCNRSFCRVGSVSHEYHLAVTRINLNLATRVRNHKKRCRDCGDWYTCSKADPMKKGAARRRDRAWRIKNSASPWNRDSYWLREHRLAPLTATEAKRLLRGLK